MPRKSIFARASEPRAALNTEPLTRDVRAEGKNATRRALLEVAGALLEQGGAQALSMRHIAQQAGCSTTVLYTLFGSKEGLANALYLEGFERLKTRLEAVSEDGPLERILALNHAYRRFALDFSMYYAIMFERPIPEFSAPPASLIEGWSSMNPLQQALQGALKAKILKPHDSETLAMQLWMTAHGVVSLELAGYLPEALGGGANHLERLIGVVLKAYQTDVHSP